MFRYFLLWSVLLLGGVVPIVHAAAPTKPNLELRMQGLNIDVEWSVPGATGYRLFYVALATPGKVEMVDMGAVTSIGGRMEPGTAMSVKVQAYNEDGDSPFSDEKSFVVNDPAATVEPGGLQPEAQPLNFQAVFLDTPVAFVPTAEDATKQRRSLRSRDNEGTEFSDGRIGMTVHIAPGLVYREELELTLCLQIDETCEPLLIYSNPKKSVDAATSNVAETSEKIAGQYADTIVIPDLPTDVEKSVYLEILMPPELTDKLRGRAESKYTVYASDVRSQNPAAKQIAVAEVPVIDLGGEDEATRTTRASTNWFGCSTSAAGGILCKTRSFAKDFANPTFGVGFSLTPGLWLFSTKNAQNQSNRGVSIGADLDATAKVFGFSIDIGVTH